MLFYLGNDPALKRIQPALVAEAKSFGLCADEYTTEQPSTGHWSPQLYVRESVRMRGATVLTQAQVCKPEPSPTAVGLSKWQVDIHAVQRVAAEVNGTWRVVNAGGRDGGRDRVSYCPGGLLEIPYEALVPARDDTSNLLVPVCISATHIAFATYRLEAQYAVFGHAAGTAAALALASGGPGPGGILRNGAAAAAVHHTAVQDINVTALRAVLLEQKQLLHAVPAARK